MKNPKFLWGSSAVLGGFTYFKVWLPLTGLSVPCPFFAVTGHFCPGCGMTRAISALLEGRFRLAAEYNLFIYIVPVVLSVYALLRHKQQTRIAETMLYTTIVLMLAFGLLRNFPLFHFLAPPNIK